MAPYRTTSFALIALMSSSLALGQAVTLRLNLSPGKAYQFSSSNKMTTSGAGNMSSMGNLGQKMSMSMKVAAKSAKGMTMVMKVTEVKFDVPPNSPMAGNMAQAAKSLKGTTIEQVYSNLAKALSTKVIGGGQGSQQMLNQFGALRTGLLGLEYPAQAVAPGATWKTTVDFSKILGTAVPGMVKMGANSKVPIVYKFVGLKGAGPKRMAQISYTMVGTMDMALGNPNNPAGGQSMTMKLTMDMKGSFLTDLASGMPMSGMANGKTTTAISGMNIVQNLSSSFTVK